MKQTRLRFITTKLLQTSNYIKIKLHISYKNREHTHRARSTEVGERGDERGEWGVSKKDQDSIAVG